MSRVFQFFLFTGRCSLSFISLLVCISVVSRYRRIFGACTIIFLKGRELRRMYIKREPNFNAKFFRARKERRSTREIRFLRDWITQSDILLPNCLWNIEFFDLYHVTWPFSHSLRSLYIQNIYLQYVKYASNNNSNNILCKFKINIKLKYKINI